MCVSVRLPSACRHSQTLISEALVCKGAGQQHDSSWEAQYDSSLQEPADKYVLKRVFTEKGVKVRLAGLREAYFGKLLQKSSVSVLQVSLSLPTRQQTVPTPFCAVDIICACICSAVAVMHNVSCI